MFTWINGKRLCRVCDAPEIGNQEHNYQQYSDYFKGGYEYEEN